MSKYGRRLLASAIGVVFVIGLSAIEDERPDRPLAPTFTAADLRAPDREIHLLEAGPLRPKLVVFFATWCSRCDGQLRDLERVRQQIGDDVRIVAVNHSDQRHDALALVSRAGVTFPVAFDPSGSIAQRYEVLEMPSIVFVGTDGRIVERHSGLPTDWELGDRIDRYF